MARKTKKKYRQYDIWVKAAISKTGRLDLFPQLKIPRMTAKYWVKQNITLEDPILESLTTALNEARSNEENLQKIIAEQKALKALLKRTTEELGFKLKWKHIDEGMHREKILSAISDAMQTASRASCLEKRNAKNLLA